MPRQTPPMSPPVARHPRWWRRPAGIAALLFLLPPLGIVFAWRSGWSRNGKITATVLSGLWFLAAVASDTEQPGTPEPTDAKRPTPRPALTAPPLTPLTPSPTPSRPVTPPNYIGMNLKEARAAAYEAGFRPDSHDASDRDQQQLVDGNWRVCFQTATPREGRRTSLDFGVVRLEAPCPPQDGAPVPWPRMPKVVGMTFEKASAAIRPTGITRIEADSAYTDVPPPSDPDAWKVCFQNPEANDPIENPAHETARLKLVAPGTRCPADAYTRLHDDNDDNDDARHHGTSTSGGSGSSAGGGGGQAGLQYGRFCSPVGARGITTDGRPAKCFMGKDGRARWGYGS